MASKQISVRDMPKRAECVHPETAPWVVVGVWCVCIPIGNYGGTLARTDYKRFAGWRSPPGLTAVRFPPTEFKLF